MAYPPHEEATWSWSNRADWRSAAGPCQFEAFPGTVGWMGHFLIL